MITSKPPKPKKCKIRGCGKEFLPRNSMHAVCGPACASIFARSKREQDEAKKAKDERKADGKKRIELKTRSDWIKDAQRAFNTFVKIRDEGKPCICCGAAMDRFTVGGGIDAGHYRSVGSAPHLRFDEENCHSQSKKCNRYGAGRAVDYRKGLIQRLGLAVVERIESDQSLKHYTIPELIAIRDTYRAKAKELQKEREHV